MKTLLPLLTTRHWIIAGRVFKAISANSAKRQARLSGIRGSFTTRLATNEEIDRYNAVVNEAWRLLDAVNDLINSQDIADKQWVGLNMCNADQKRAHEIIQASRIRARTAIARWQAFDDSK